MGALRERNSIPPTKTSDKQFPPSAPRHSRGSSLAETSGNEETPSIGCGFLAPLQRDHRWVEVAAQSIPSEFSREPHQGIVNADDGGPFGSKEVGLGGRRRGFRLNID